jgi:pimeloyl-ACP methyl ester carboxylesterase
MQRKPMSFYSERAFIDGDLFLPDNPGDKKLPVVIVLSGFQGFKDIHPARFARFLTADGFAAFAFDYRGWGQSEGERGRWSPQDQVEDVHAAISLLELQPELDPARISLLGWGLGGSVGIVVGAHDQRVERVAACNPLGDGARAMKAMHTDESWEWLMEAVKEDRGRRVTRGDRPHRVDPFDVIRLDEVTREYVSQHLYAESSQVAGQVTLQSADLLMRFCPEGVVGMIAPRPLLLVFGGANALHRPEEAYELYQKAGDPKKLIMLEGVGHTEWMFDSNPVYLRVARLMSKFFAGETDPEKNYPPNAEEVAKEYATGDYTVPEQE